MLYATRRHRENFAAPPTISFLSFHVATMPDTPPSAPRRSWPRRMLNRLEVDQAVFFAILARAWQFLAGPVTLLLIATHFTGVEQGYYYTFWSMIGLQTFFELSFHNVVLNVASHEWEKLALTTDRTITGDASALSRLASLLRVTAVIYGVGAILFLAVVSFAGWVFFGWEEGSHLIHWQAPWVVLVALTALAFWMTPFLTVLEGCNQVKPVYQLHFARAVAGNLIVWVCIPLGASLWTPVIATIIRLACEGYFIAFRYRRFYSALLRKPTGPVLDWRVEVWPFQWRMGLRGLLGYFNAYLINPIVFHYAGPVAAGQMGMTWQVLTSLQAAALSWVTTRTARFGMLVAKRDFVELDRIFFRLTAIAFGMLSVGSIVFCIFVTVLYWSGTVHANRLLPPLPTAIFALALSIAVISNCQWTYMHAHKRSPYLLLTLVGSLLNGGLIWWWGSRYGATGAAVALLAMNGMFHLPIWSWVWFRERLEWHENPESRDNGVSIS